MSLAVGGVTRTEHGTTPITVEAHTAAPALLPAAGDLPSPGGMMGAMEQLYAAMSEMRDENMQLGQSKVKENHQKSEVARKEREDAIRRADDAANKGGVMDWLSKDIGVAGVVGLCTFNYALVAADIAAHKLNAVENVKIDVIDVAAVGVAASGYVGVLATDMLVRKTDILPAEAREVLASCGIPQDAPGISDEDAKPVAKKVLVASIVATSIAATALSGGTAAGMTIALAGLALSATGGYVAEEKALDGICGKGSSRWIGLGMQITGAVTASAGGMIPGKAVVSGGAAFSTAVNGTRTAVQGADTIVNAHHTWQSEHATIDAEVWKQRLVQLERFAERVIEGAKESTKSANRAEGSLRSAMETHLQTQTLLTAGTRA